MKSCIRLYVRSIFLSPRFRSRSGCLERLWWGPWSEARDPLHTEFGSHRAITWAPGSTRAPNAFSSPSVLSSLSLFLSSFFYLNLIILISKAHSSFFLFVVTTIVGSSSTLGGSSRPMPNSTKVMSGENLNSRNEQFCWSIWKFS